MDQADENYKDPNVSGHVLEPLVVAVAPWGLAPEGRSPVRLSAFAGVLAQVAQLEISMLKCSLRPMCWAEDPMASGTTPCCTQGRNRDIDRVCFVGWPKKMLRPDDDRHGFLAAITPFADGAI